MVASATRPVEGPDATLEAPVREVADRGPSPRVRDVEGEGRPVAVSSLTDGLVLYLSRCASRSRTLSRYRRSGMPPLPFTATGLQVLRAHDAPGPTARSLPEVLRCSRRRT